MPGLDRRDLLLGTGAVALLAATGGCEIIKQIMNNRPVRRNILSLDPNGIEMKTFRDGVAAMRALPGSDPRNWTRQAEIHRDFCPHGNWYFLPWHRAYLLGLERIIRKLTGNNQFALPYWNWSPHCPGAPPFHLGGWDCAPWSRPCHIPAPFFDVGSPLYHGRGRGPCHRVKWWYPPVTQQILNETNFELFASLRATALRNGGGGYGILEESVHNFTHAWVGGDMATFMSPLDPLFWCHHNVIDCIWAHWNMVLGRPNTNDPQWTQFQLSGMFVDENGNPEVQQVGATPLYPLFLYRCEDDETHVPGSLRIASPRGNAGWRAADEKAVERFLRDGAETRFRPLSTTLVASNIIVSPERPTQVQLRIPEQQLKELLGAASERRIFLRLGQVAASGLENVYIRVFADNPEGDEQTPIDDPSYAGSFAFFTDPAAMKMSMPMTSDYLVELSAAMRRRAARGDFRGAVKVTLFPAPVAEDRPAATKPIRIEEAFLVTTALDPEPRPLH